VAPSSASCDMVTFRSMNKVVEDNPHVEPWLSKTGLTINMLRNWTPAALPNIMLSSVFYAASPSVRKHLL